MKEIIVGLVTLGSMSTFAHVGDQSQLISKAEKCYKQYERAYDNSAPVGNVADEIHEALAYDQWPLITLPVATITMLAIEAAALPFRLALAPVTVPRMLRNSKGMDIYEGIHAEWSESGHTDLYLKLLKTGQQHRADFSEEELNKIILTSYAEKFCAKKIKASRRQMKKYILKEIEKA